MSTIALVFFFLLRVGVPFAVLITAGEWVRRREIKYWFHV
jgi:hypothetical protein